MPIHDKNRYGDNWENIALQVKQSANWRCKHCGQECLRPGEKPREMSRAEWTMMTLSIHHANFTPEDNRLDNLIPLCAPCHIGLHGRARGRSNTSPGQLELPLGQLRY